MLVQQYQQGLLPSLRITKFTGDPLGYSTFVRSFESQIESKVKSSDYLEGEPRELIKGCLHLDKLNGYLEAKKLLSEKYVPKCDELVTISDHPQSSSQYAKYGEEASFPTSGPVGEEKLTDGEGHDKLSLPLLNL
ncbi:hypothetical protein P5673_012576 [Acropora cervicornis]|uniref:Uncharacterized protein n=1 Tax=Acropora cervicornis TaxID=6130 RepID=A0AAD9V7Y2_ACRCE|nr:hypothetical protein P5673_012576 [Acropora cervicornis]